MPRYSSIDFPDLDEDCLAVFVPIEYSLIPIIGGLMEPLKWRARYATEEDYQRGVEWYECFQRRLGLSCREFDLADNIRRLAEAMQVCCAMQNNPGVPYFEPDPSEEETPWSDPPPLGYESWAEWFGVKCDMASSVVDYYIAGFQKLFDLGEQGANILIVPALAEVIKAVGLSIAALQTILASIIVALGLAAVESLVEALEALKPGLVCALYNGETVQEARASWNAVIDGSEYDGLVRTMLTNLFPTDLANAFFGNGSLPHLLPLNPGDCSACEDIDLTYHVYTRHTFPYDYVVLGVVEAEEKAVFNGFRLRKVDLVLESVQLILDGSADQNAHYRVFLDARSYSGYAPATVEFRDAVTDQLLETLGTLPLTGEWVLHEFQTAVMKPPGTYKVVIAPNIGVNNNGWVRSVEVNHIT